MQHHGFGALVFLTGSFCAQLLPAGTIDLSDAGWRVSWPQSQDPFITVMPLATGGPTAHIDVVYHFTDAQYIGEGREDPMVLSFAQTRAHAVPTIAITGAIHNDMSRPWDGFRLFLMSGVPNSVFEVSTESAGGYDVAPFTQAVCSNDGQVLELSGGIVPSGGAFWPAMSQDALVIDTAAFSDGPNFKAFALKAFSISVPEPTTGLLLAGGVCLLLRRSRRALSLENARQARSHWQHSRYRWTIARGFAAGFRC